MTKTSFTFKKFTTLMSVSALSLVLLNNAGYAQTTPPKTEGDQVSASVNDASNRLIQWLNDNLVLGVPYLFPQTMKGNSQNIAANDSVSTATYNSTQPLVTQSFISPNTGSIMMQSAALVPSLGKKNPEQSAQQTASIFNISSMMSVMGIDPQSDDEKKMKAMIGFISGQANPIAPLDSNTARANTAPVQQYLTSYGGYISAQSVGLNVLYSLLNDRIRQQGLGEGVGNNSDMSPLELDHYMATRRLSVEGTNSDWLKKMGEATPAQVSKENLMLQAENRYELYLIARKLDTLNATMATLLLLQNQTIGNQLMSIQRKAAVQSVTGNPGGYAP